MVSFLGQAWNTKPRVHSQDYRQLSPKRDDQVSVVNINPKTFGTVCSVEIKRKEKFEKQYSTSKREFALFLTKVLAIADKREEAKLYKLDLRKFNTAGTANKEFHTAAAAIWQRITSFWYNTDDVLVRVLPVAGASQRHVPALLRPSVLHLWHY